MYNDHDATTSVAPKRGLKLVYSLGGSCELYGNLTIFVNKGSDNSLQNQ